MILTIRCDMIRKSTTCSGEYLLVYAWTLLLFYYGYSERAPFEWHQAVDKNISRYKTKMEYPFVKNDMFELHNMKRIEKKENAQ